MPNLSTHNHQRRFLRKQIGPLSSLSLSLSPGVGSYGNCSLLNRRAFLMGSNPNRGNKKTMPEFETIQEAIEYLLELYGDLDPDDYIEIDFDISGDTG